MSFIEFEIVRVVRKVFVDVFIFFIFKMIRFSLFLINLGMYIVGYRIILYINCEVL